MFVEREDLVQFDDWLKLFWPGKGDAQPPIPTGIRDEMREEAGGDCALSATPTRDPARRQRGEVAEETAERRTHGSGDDDRIG